ncbi:protein naked cuticle 1 [Crotalus adamanteus]|uniref:Protein naked cuticle homolog n=1 Tax=Crotalus adamanteus TaxID=8729 RepID=A0AAW1AT63_CROAD
MCRPPPIGIQRLPASGLISMRCQSRPLVGAGKSFVTASVFGKRGGGKRKDGGGGAREGRERERERDSSSRRERKREGERERKKRVIRVVGERERKKRERDSSGEREREGGKEERDCCSRRRPGASVSALLPPSPLDGRSGLRSPLPQPVRRLAPFSRSPGREGARRRDPQRRPPTLPNASAGAEPDRAMGKLHSKHAAACKPRENPEGDSFAVNASLARKGLEEWPVNPKGDGDGGLRVPLEGCPHRALGKGSGPRRFFLALPLLWCPPMMESCNSHHPKQGKLLSYELLVLIKVRMDALPPDF